MTMKKYCCIILTLALVLAGCSTTKPADSVSSTYETTETNLESTSSNESTNPSAGEETSNANCYTIEEVANGAADGTVDEHGIEMFPEEATQKAQDAINGGYVLNGLGATFEDTGITYTLQDVWYEKTTDNIIIIKSGFNTLHNTPNTDFRYFTFISLFNNSIKSGVYCFISLLFIFLFTPFIYQL